jgi:diguanylate cyclase (GGDEF)-like protein
MPGPRKSRTVHPGGNRLPLWRRLRRSAAAPIWLIVTVAVVSIAFAVISSAQRADVVALANERALVTHALSERQSVLLRGAQRIAHSKNDLHHLWLSVDQAWLHDQVGVLAGSPEFDLAFVIDRPSAFVYPLSEQKVSSFNSLRSAALGKLADFVDALAPPSENDALGLRGPLRPPGVPRAEVRLQTFLQRPAIVAAAALDPSVWTGAQRTAPALVLVRFISPKMLHAVGDQLELSNLRLVEGTPTANEHTLELPDGAASTIRLTWVPKHPGSEIVRDILPYIAIALGCFLLLAGFVLRYMRRTTATIAAGENRLRHIAMHDSLSGLPNRMLFGDRLELQIEDVKRGGPPAALLSIDLDHFKDVNDTLGHHVGDGLIGAVAERLCRIVREEDLVARLGGDEFAVLTTAATDLSTLTHMADRIIETLSAPYAVAGHTLVIGASIGIVVIDRRVKNAADTMRFADMALYRAKNEGRNRACLYDAAMNADLTERKQIEQDLRLAIERSGLTLAYQPLVSPDGERMIGVEALCRWPHPVRGQVPPTQFIPIAEQSELIIPLGEWVLRRACMDGNAWPSLIVAVNVSPLQFRRPDFVEVVERILAETGFDPPRLELELTETTLLGNVEGAGAAMRRLKALGVKLALDDFGTGYSSLLYLRKFPFDKLKIDRSFINNIETAADAAAIVHAIVGLGRGLGMKVTAEGVENAEQQLFLRAAGVHIMQGFRFGLPTAAAAITERLANQAASVRPAARPRAALAS